MKAGVTKKSSSISRSSGTASVSPEESLRRALAARTPSARAKHAKMGLAAHPRLDPTVHAMLLRQLYLAFFETERFDEALSIAEQATSLGVLTDVLHHDAARAALAAGHVESSVVHLRTASRTAPASRRAQHLWVLGGTLFLVQRYIEAIASLTRATRWATKEKPLYRAHLALTRMASGESVEELQEIVDSLANAPCGQGYGRFVLGHLAYASGEWNAARRYLSAFVKRTMAGGAVLRHSLAGELEMARATLAKIDNN